MVRDMALKKIDDRRRGRSPCDWIQTAAIEEAVAIRRELARARPAPWAEFIKDYI
jgi:hypothetical protein